MARNSNRVTWRVASFSSMYPSPESSPPCEVCVTKKVHFMELNPYQTFLERAPDMDHQMRDHITDLRTNNLFRPKFLMNEFWSHFTCKHAYGTTTWPKTLCMDLVHWYLLHKNFLTRANTPFTLAKDRYAFPGAKQYHSLAWAAVPQILRKPSPHTRHTRAGLRFNSGGEGHAQT